MEHLINPWTSCLLNLSTPVFFVFLLSFFVCWASQLRGASLPIDKVVMCCGVELKLCPKSEAKASFQHRKAFSIILSSFFNAPLSCSSDKTAANSASTFISLAAARFKIASCFSSSSVVFTLGNGSCFPLSAKRTLVGYGALWLTENTFCWSLARCVTF